MLTYEVNIVCDDWEGECPNLQHVKRVTPCESARIGENKVLQFAKIFGWLTVNGKNYCPDCVKNMPADQLQSIFP